MNFDMIFCSGARCKKANTCERWHMNLKKWVEENKIDIEDRQISMAEFSDHDGTCRNNMYIPIENLA